MKSLFVLLGSALALNAYAVTPVVYHQPSQIPMPNMGNDMHAMPAPGMSAMDHTAMPAMDHHMMPPVQHTQSAAHQAKTVMVQHGQSTITVKLNANATTGYTWLLGDYDHSLLTLLSYNYQAPQTQRVGAGGQAVFTFHVNPAMFAGPQVATLKFHYAQPWQYSDQGQAQVVNVISVGSSAGHSAQSGVATPAGLTTRSTVANPYTPPMQTTNAMPAQSAMGSPSASMPKMHNTAAPTQHGKAGDRQNTWLSLPADHQDQTQQ